MALSSDGLLDHLLFHIAISGKQGLDVESLSKIVQAFDDRNPTTQEAEDDEQDDGNDIRDVLFSSKPPGSTATPLTRASDPQQIEKLWAWLVEQPDVLLCHSNENETELDSAAPDQAKTESGAETAHASQYANPLASVMEAHSGQVLQATEERVWTALTGHGVDFKRIPKLEFLCLSAIAAAGPKGILQPDVTRITGQDKRSVPKRTDALAQKGLVIKESCIGNGIKTSLLRFAKFAQEGTQETFLELETTAGRWQNGTVHRVMRYDEWFAELIRHLKEHNSIMALDDLRKEMGIWGKKWETRILHRCVRRLGKAGLVQRLKARATPKDAEEADANGSAGEDVAPKTESPHKKGRKRTKKGPPVRWVRCVKLLREPTEKDRTAFTSAAERELDDAGGDQDDSGADDEEMPELDPDGSTYAAPSASVKTQMQRAVPLWRPGLHHTQLIFNLIDACGTQGISTMDLTELSMGHLWRRPLDELLGRLTDVWKVSQPPHLRHLSIIRDAAFYNRVSHYQFRTFNNFKRLVEQGGVTWEAMGVQTSDIENETAELDEWGFPPVRPGSMTGPDGRFSVVHCRNPVGKPRAQRAETAPTSAPMLQSTPMSRLAFAPKQYIQESPLHRTISTTESTTADREVDKATASSVAAHNLDTRPGVSRQPTPADTPRRLKGEMKPKRVEAELKAWKARAQRLAEDRVRSELGLIHEETGSEPPKKRLKGKSSQNSKKRGQPPLPEDRVNEVKDAIMNLAIPGVYIMPPGAEQLKMATVMARGRPRKCLIAVFKSEKLSSLPWFTHSEESPEPDNHLAAEADHDLRNGPMESTEGPGSNALTEPQPSFKSAGFVTESVSADTSQGPADQTLPVQRHEESVKDTQQLLPISNSHILDTSGQESRPLPPDDLLPGAPQSSVSSTQAAVVSENKTVTEHMQPAATSSDVEQATQEQPLQHPSQALQDSVPLAAVHSADIMDIDSIDLNPAQCSEVMKADRIGSPSLAQAENDAIGRGASHNESSLVQGTHEQTLGVTNDTHPEKSESHAAADPSSQPTASAEDVVQSAAKTNLQTMKGKVGVNRSGGIVSFQRMQIILDLVRQAGGVFGGDRELYYPFLTAWAKIYNRKPDRHTFDRLMAKIVTEGRLKKVSFTIESPNGMPQTKHVIVEPEIDIESHVVKALQNKIIENFPFVYIPEGTALASEYRLRLEAERGLPPKESKVMTIKDHFPEDQSTFITRLHSSTPRYPVKLGMTEERLEKDVAARRRKRAQEEKRRQRYLDAMEEEEIEQAQAEFQTDFQLDSYQHEPDRARIDRGPAGRSRLSTLQRWGAKNSDGRKRNPLLGAGSRRKLATRETMDEPFYLGSLAGKSYAAALSSSSLVELFSLTSPYQHYHAQSGTFSTDPVVIATTGNVGSSEYGLHTGFAGQQLPMSLAEIFRHAGGDGQSPGEDLESVNTASARYRSLHPRSGSFAPPRFPPKRRLPSDMSSLGFSQDGPVKRPKVAIPAGPYSARSMRPTLSGKPPAWKAAQPRASRNGIFVMNEGDEQRLVIAVVVVRTLTGGLEQLTNWGIVHQIFHYKFDPNYCRNRWAHLRGKLGATADKLQAKFQALYIDAYQKGEVPEIDFVDVEKYDWLSLVEWAEQRLETSDIDFTLEELPDLPRSRELLDNSFIIETTPEQYDATKDDFWALQITNVRREELAYNWTHCVPMESEKSPGDPLMLAKSWVRANIITPDERYDSHSAHTKLQALGEATISRALDALLGAKIIRLETKSRSLPGRHYDISDTVLATFKRPWDASQLRAAAALKPVFDAAFASSPEGTYTPRYHAPDPEILALTNLLAAGHVRITPALPGRNDALDAPWPRLTKWGFTQGNYKTAQMDRSRLHFSLAFSAAESYVPGCPLHLHVPPPLSRQFAGEPAPRLPLWTDVHGRLIPTVWDMVRVALLWLVHFRPGVGVKALARTFRGKVWEWEVRVWVEWAERVGLLVRMGDGGAEGEEEVGWRTGEWWWLAFGEG